MRSDATLICQPQLRQLAHGRSTPFVSRNPIFVVNACEVHTACHSVLSTMLG
eukprot:m.673181 g.673181  ORF g.673181 m.673181 type:complete len:52 (-) comp22779_c0_seq4:133-288(-)